MHRSNTCTPTCGGEEKPKKIMTFAIPVLQLLNHYSFAIQSVKLALE
jgi:hypothetical protein